MILKISILVLSVTGLSFITPVIPVFASAGISVSLLHLILTLLAASIIVIVILYYFTLKLKRVNIELEGKNAEIERISENLKSVNHDLSSEKAEMAKELSDSDSFFRTLLQSAEDGISFYDVNWNLEFANAAFYSMIGVDSREYHALESDSFLHPEDLKYREQSIEALKTQGYYEGEIRIKHKDGTFLNLSTRSIVIRSEQGEVKGYFTISRDITKLKKYHEDLIQAKVEAETSNRLKTSFLANISHEIRTPLNSVVGFANLLLADDLPRSVREEYLDHINYNSEKLLQIIGDIIDLSRLESSQIEITYEETSLNEIINEVIDDTRKSIKRNEKPIILTLKNNFEESSDLIFTDKLWLKRVLNHLMDNAVKFTLEGTVELSYAREGGYIAFRVKDTGIGIRKESLNWIFEGFRQEIDGHHRPFEGLGVGLTLANEVIKRMGGKIDVQSEKGMGSEFYFTIPYRQAGSLRKRVRDEIKNEGVINWSSKKCLLVDDNKDVLIYLNRILMDTGINVLMARTGSEAIEIVKNTPDLNIIILDMQMPEMNGIEVTKAIRKISKNLPIIAQTAFIFEDDKDIVLEAGCDACLLKPIRREHLLSSMAAFMSES